ncbi:uncharacterized protein LOC125942904 [Dermacentor silvarum]|uniref:uncharacterized protein LOC125942904 n=1 Tax=Dermacentor silvarum TaxID=543639 RepID=UPI0021008CCD|nr:uncharacterized protein LOC125942904 [Dermacentor silvarum]
MPTCCAVGCSNSVAKGGKLFAVPRGKRDLKRRAIWLHRIGRKNFDCHRGRLCEKHFTDDQFEPVILARTGCKKLKPNAVPSIFLHRPVPKERKPPRRREKEAVYAAASDKPGSSAETTPDPEPTCDTYTAASNNPGSSAEATAEPEPTCGSPSQ